MAALVDSTTSRVREVTGQRRSLGGPVGAKHAVEAQARSGDVRRGAGQWRVVIVGAGFGGLQCARKLARTPVQVTLVDRNNYHLFTPLLYQVASSLLNPSDIARPVRSILQRGTARFRQADVVRVDFERKCVLTGRGEEIGYDILVIAAGSTTNFFGVQQAEDRALGLKDLGEALELRNHLLMCLESATTAAYPDRRQWLTFVIVGGGPTGVEYAGALAELIRLVVPNEYPELNRSDVRIVLVEGLDEVLPPFPPELGRIAHQELASKGVEVRTSARVTAYQDDTVVLSNGDSILAKTLVWAAGVRPNGLARLVDVPRSRTGRIEVDEFLRVKGHDDVFAIGDIASSVRGGSELPMLSAPAIQQGRLTADNIRRRAMGRPLRPFRYRDRGSMATIGKNAAVAKIGRLRLSGFVGWVMWLVVHLYYLIGFRNRFVVLLGWSWNYLRSDRPVRIVAPARQRPP
jgi:NADH dehydrogenase